MGIASTTKALEIVITEIEYSTGLKSSAETREEITVFDGYSKVVTETMDTPSTGDKTTVATIIEPYIEVDDVEITSLYDSLMTKHITRLDAQFDAERINSDMYAKVFASLMQPTMQLATSTVQQQPVLDAQVAKTEADTSFVGTQETELSASVIFNNKIKALDSYSDMIGTMGAGSLVISEDMFTAFFNMVGALNGDMGANPADTVVIKAV